MFYRICETVQDYGKYVPADEDINKYVKQNKPFYQSIYMYSDEQVKAAQEIIEVTKNKKKIKRPRGIAGITDVVTKKLVWDFDSEKIEESKQDAITLVDKLITEGFKEENLGIYFSGGKGFHVEIETNSLLTPQQFKAITSSLARGLKTYDSVVANPSRIFRVANTKHNSSGLFKTRLSSEELKNLSVQEVLEIAKEAYEPEGLKETSIPSSLLALGERVEANEITRETLTYDPVVEFDPMVNPMGLSNWKNALFQGFIPPGSRNFGFMILTASLKAKGFTEDQCYAALKATIRSQSLRYNQEPFSKEEFYNNIVSQVFSSTWQGGTFSEDNFPEEVKEHLAELGIERITGDEIDEDLVVDVEQGFDNFFDYAINIDKNRLNFGIPELDRLLKPQKGHLIGLLAGPGIGKTSMALELLSNTSKEGCKSFFGSYDMNSSILFQKLLQRETRLTDDEIYDIYRNGDREKIANFKKILTNNYENVTFCFKVGQTIGDLKRSIAKREKQLGEKIGLVVVDYIELIMSDKSDATAASAEAAQGLREIANSGKVVVVLLQPNKMSSKADEAPKTYNAAKGSSAIAQAVTSMMGCFRPGYNPEDTSMDKFFGVAILKNRMGPLGTCYFNWHGPTGRITQMEDIERQELQQYLDWKKSNSDDGDGGL